MQLGSTGARALKGLPTSTLASQRAIHIPSFIPHPHVPARSTAQTFFKQTRTLLSRFVTHLTTPGTLRAPVGVSIAARPFHAGPGSLRTIQQGLSPHARFALSRPLNAPHLPRAPIVPRSIAQVGLGAARNFSTARPIFQDLVQNVPVAGRAFWEADWELKIKEERDRMNLQKAQKKAQKKARKSMLQPKPQTIVVPEPVVTPEVELEHYFPAAPAPEITTVILIPLAPTPTARLPLPLSPTVSTSHPLLPYSILASMHSSHSTHASRVSSLFARLDSAHVFDESGVSCTAYGDSTGLCTVLEVSFTGWTLARVRGVIGEAGRGWCHMEEVWNGHELAEQEEMEDMLSEMSLESSVSDFDHSRLGHSPGVRLEDIPIEIDPSQSFVLPTLDFSASFPAVANSWSGSLSSISPSSTPLSDLEFHNTWSSMERHLDTLSESDSGGESDEWVHAMDTGSSYGVGSPGAYSSSESLLGFGFSSAFSEQMEGESRAQAMF